MAKRYYVCPIIGSGTDADTYRASVHDHGVNYSAVVDVNFDAAGAPVKRWCLVVVSAADHSALVADSKLTALPNVALDTPMSSIPAAAKTALITALTARGIDTTFVGSAATVRDVLRGIGRKLHPAFLESGLDVL